MFSDFDAVMFVSNCETHMITGYRLPSSTFLRNFGGKGHLPGQLIRPHKMCLAPNGDIIVCETGNKRLQRFTQLGSHVRFYGNGCDLLSFVWGVACNADVVAVGTEAASRVVLFNIHSGGVVRAFGPAGDSPGQIGHMRSVRFTPDNHIIVAEYANNRLSVFNVDGTFVKVIDDRTLPGLNWPHDVDFAPNGDMIVVSYYRIDVLNHDGSLLLNSFGGPCYSSTGMCEAGEFICPAALPVALFNGRLHVVDHSTSKIQVFL